MGKHGLFVLVALLCSIPAAAQDRGRTGLAIGFPASIGIIWHASDSIAIRPEFSFTRTHNKSEPPSGLETSSWGFGLGVSALFYTGEVRENVRTYFTPRFAYTRTSSNSKSSSSTLEPSTTHINGYQYSGAFGVQYSPTKRFAVYGEAGVAYGRSHSTAETGIGIFGDTTGYSLASRAGVGVTLYFD